MVDAVHAGDLLIGFGLDPVRSTPDLAWRTASCFGTPRECKSSLALKLMRHAPEKNDNLGRLYGNDPSGGPHEGRARVAADDNFWS